MTDASMDGLRVVDLSTHVNPLNSTRPCKLRRRLNRATGDYHSRLTITSHLGTHVESPWHIGIERDLCALPASAFVGRGVLVRCSSAGPGAYIEDDDLARLLPGDIAILDSPWRSEPFRGDPNDLRPQLTVQAAELLADHGVKAVGLGSGVAIENDNAESLRVHRLLLNRDILLLEVLRNLDALRSRVFFLAFLPLPIAGLDSCCVRAVAIEGLPGFTEETS